jgi:hypothetical protein
MHEALLYRAAVTEPNGIDITAGTARLSFASEHPVLRRDDKKHGTHIEILSHGPGDVNNSILERGAPVLLDHNDGLVIGGVQPGTFAVGSDRKSRATIQVDPEWRSYLKAIAEGEAPNQTSVGYSTLSILRREQGADGVPILTFSWLPEEISILTRGHPPADPRVGLGRSLNMKNSLDELLTLALSGSRKTDDDVISDCPPSELMRSLFGRGTNRAEKIFEQTRSAAGQPYGRFVPVSLLAPRKTRDMQATVFPSGGALVATELSSDAIRLAFNKSIVINSGAKIYSGLRANYSKVKLMSSPTVESLTEIQTVTASDILTMQDALQPCRVSAQVRISKQLALQGGELADETIRSTLTDAIATALDAQFVFGGGGGAQSQMLGIMNTPGVQSIWFNGAASWGTILQAEQNLANANLDFGKLGWALSPASRARWKQITKISGSSNPIFLINDDGKVGEYPARASTQLSSTHQAIFGMWDSIELLFWGAPGGSIEIIVDPITQAAQGEIVFTALAYANINLSYAQAVVVSSDAANQ